MAKYRIEVSAFMLNFILLNSNYAQVLFWGVRELRRLNLLPIERPRIDVECAGRVLSSDIIHSASANPNFDDLIKTIDLVR
jgi:hypothetical protein